MSRYVMSCHVMSRLVISCRVMTRHVISCHVMSCHVMSCHVLQHHVVSCLVVSRWFVVSRPSRVVNMSCSQETLTTALTSVFDSSRVSSVGRLASLLRACRVTLCHVVSCSVMSCHVVSCHVMSCHVMSCRVMSCHVLSCRHVVDVMSCYVASVFLCVTTSQRLWSLIIVIATHVRVLSRKNTKEK